MEAGAAQLAVEAAVRVARSCALLVDDSLVVNDSNRLVVRLLPCDVVARIVPEGYRVFAGAMGAEREVELLRCLAAAGAPIATLESRVAPRVFVRDGFEIELLAHYPATPARPLPAEGYVGALERLHETLADIDVEVPRFTERVADVRRWVGDPAATPDLGSEDRDLLVATIDALTRAVVDRGAPEQRLHGEPHPWNVLDTTDGLRFVDFENCVVGPVEWDLGWVPLTVSERYPSADPQLADSCRGLVLSIVAAHCWRPQDERPGRDARETYLSAVRRGPPWVALDAV